MAGFPNLFMLVGPNTGLGHTSLIYMIESQVAYTIDALRHLERTGAPAVEVRPEAQLAYNRIVQRRMAGTVWTAGGCASWYLDTHGHNTTLWPTFTWRFRRGPRGHFNPPSTCSTTTPRSPRRPEGPLVRLFVALTPPGEVVVGVACLHPGAA